MFSESKIFIDKNPFIFRVVFDENKYIVGFFILKDNNYSNNNSEPDSSYYESGIAYDDTFNKLDYIYNTEINNKEYEILGELLLPESSEDLVIILSGSGPSHMNGISNVYKSLAQKLYLKNISTIRTNKVMVDSPEIMEFNKFTIKDEYIIPTISLLRDIKNNKLLKDKKIYVLGHSQGGNIIPMLDDYLKKENIKIDGYIFVSANVSKIDELIKNQVEYILRNDKVINSNDDYVDEYNDILEDVKKLKNIENLNDSEKVLGANAYYFKDYFKYDFKKYASEIKVPSLILQGENDYQVTMDEFNKIKEINNDNFKFISYPKITHLLYELDDISVPSNYEIIVDVDDKIVEDIFKFIEDNK